MKFPYVKIPTSDPKRRWISRPIIPITLFGSEQSVNIDALIDSGADKCLFHNEIGREIGLEVKKGVEEIFSGIAGKEISAFIHKVKLQIRGMAEEIEISAGFTDAPGVFAILGQEGFFDNFRIKFERDHDTIEITPIKK